MDGRLSVAARPARGVRGPGSSFPTGGTFTVPSAVAVWSFRDWFRPAMIAVVAGAVAVLLAAASSAAASAGFAPGDVVVYRTGTGSGALSSSATPVFLDEYEPGGKLVESLTLPTTASAPNKPLLASGSASSEGLLTLSADGGFLMATGYAAAAGTAKVAETTSSSVPRTIARVGAGGEVNTTTALTDAASGNNVRSATSSDGTNIWVGGPREASATRRSDRPHRRGSMKPTRTSGRFRSSTASSTPRPTRPRPGR